MESVRKTSCRAAERGVTEMGVVVTSGDDVPSGLTLGLRGRGVFFFSCEDGGQTSYPGCCKRVRWGVCVGNHEPISTMIRDCAAEERQCRQASSQSPVVGVRCLKLSAMGAPFSKSGSKTVNQENRAWLGLLLTVCTTAIRRSSTTGGAGEEDGSFKK